MLTRIFYVMAHWSGDWDSRLFQRAHHHATPHVTMGVAPSFAVFASPTRHKYLILVAKSGGAMWCLVSRRHWASVDALAAEQRYSWLIILPVVLLANLCMKRLIYLMFTMISSFAKSHNFFSMFMFGLSHNVNLNIKTIVLIFNCNLQ